MNAIIVKSSIRSQCDDISPMVARNPNMWVIAYARNSELQILVLVLVLVLVLTGYLIQQSGKRMTIRCCSRPPSFVPCCNLEQFEYDKQLTLSNVVSINTAHRSRELFAHFQCSTTRRTKISPSIRAVPANCITKTALRQYGDYSQRTIRYASWRMPPAYLVALCETHQHRPLVSRRF